MMENKLDELAGMVSELRGILGNDDSQIEKKIVEIQTQIRDIAVELYPNHEFLYVQKEDEEDDD